MFFSTKIKGYFIELSDYGCMLARTSSATAPFVVEAVEECPVNDEAALAEALKRLQTKKSPSGYLHATCGFYPMKRLVRRAPVDLKRVKDPAYFGEVVAAQFRVEPEKYAIAVLQTSDGTDYEVTKATQKEALFCGLPSEDILTL